MPATRISSAQMRDHQDEARNRDKAHEEHAGIGSADHEAGQHFEQHVPCHHRHEEPQTKAEAGARGMSTSSITKISGIIGSGVPWGTNNEKKCSPCFQKPTTSTIPNDRIASTPGGSEVAGEGERVNADKAQRQEAEQSWRKG